MLGEALNASNFDHMEQGTSWVRRRCSTAAKSKRRQRWPERDQGCDRSKRECLSYKKYITTSKAIHSVPYFLQFDLEPHLSPGVILNNEVVSSLS